MKTHRIFNLCGLDCFNFILSMNEIIKQRHYKCVGYKKIEQAECGGT
jgi:hypothetical protein